MQNLFVLLKSILFFFFFFCRLLPWLPLISLTENKPQWIRHIPALVFSHKLLTGILSSPFSSGGFITSTVGLVDVSQLGNKRIVRVGVCEERADREKNYKTQHVSQHALWHPSVYITLWDGQCRRPLILQNVQTNAAIAVDVGMVDFGSKVDLLEKKKKEWADGYTWGLFCSTYLGRLEWIVSREMNWQKEQATLVRAVILHGCELRLLQLLLRNMVLTGPTIVACQWNSSSPTGPAEQFEGGSRSRSLSSCRHSISMCGLY